MDSAVLVVDDDEGIRLLLEAMLSASGYTVAVAATAAAALQLCASANFDAILLDRLLPDADTVTLIPALRAAAPTAAILMLSATDDLDARVTALHRGADDFLTKPFHVSEVIARIEAVLRRSGAAQNEPEIIRYGDLTVDIGAHRVKRGDDVISLTPTELRLLRVLAENRERVLSRAQILEHVWQYDFGGSSEVVEKAISNLRRKVDDGRVPLIQTIRGFGYCLRLEG